MSDPKKEMHKVIDKKIKRLVNLESLLNTEFNSNGVNLFISRKIFACIDGFVILRTFSKERYEPFKFSIAPIRLNVFLKNELPINTSDRGIVNFYNLLKKTIGLELRIGQTIDIGSNGSGVRIGNTSTFIDGFQLLIREYKDMESTEEIIIDMINAHKAYTSDLEIKILESQIAELQRSFDILTQEINKSTLPIIITEGKTDWKYFITALKYFHSRNEFVNIDPNWFLKFGTKEDVESGICDTKIELTNSVSNLNKILDSFVDARKIQSASKYSVIIGIFDSDDNTAKSINDFNKKVFSIIIKPKDISSEFLFSDTELKSSKNNRRLYIGEEFDKRTGQLLNDRSIILGTNNNTRNKAGKRKIIDTDVFNIKGINIAMSKDEFANAVYLGEIKISAESFLNFRHIFEKIEEFLK